MTTHLYGPLLRRRRFLRHPSWALRLVRNKARWWAAGRPLATPLPHGGHLLACPHGTGLASGWHFWVGPGYHGAFTVDRLWDRMSAEHPVERVDYLHNCPACTRTAT